MRSSVPVVVMVLALMSGCGSSGGAVAPQGPADEIRSPAPSEAAPGADDEPVANTLKWTTASEVENFGFDIYRSLSEDGPFDKITDSPLPGAGTTDEPQRYVYEDADIDPSNDYYYYIESISLGGIREKFSPVIKAPAKRPVPSND